MPLPWSKIYHVRCPDGTTRTVYRKIDDAFPLYVQGSDTKVSAGVKDGVGAISGNVNAEHQSKVENLLVAIDSKNNSLMVKFRAAYLVYMTNPCGQSEYFANQVKHLSEIHDRLTEVELGAQSLIALIRSKPTATDAIYSLFRELVTKLGPATPELNGQAAQLAIEDARREARTWIDDAEVNRGES